MKKKLAVILAACLVFAGVMPAYAAEAVPEQAEVPAGTAHSTAACSIVVAP